MARAMASRSFRRACRPSSAVRSAWSCRQRLSSPSARATGKLAFVDLAKCTSARHWLDARREVDPARAIPELLTELERTVGAGRFASEGEIATVVRESAAMLFAHALVAQRGGPSALRAIETTRDHATGSDTRGAWDAAVGVVTR